MKITTTSNVSRKHRATAFFCIEGLATEEQKMTDFLKSIGVDLSCAVCEDDGFDGVEITFMWEVDASSTKAKDAAWLRRKLKAFNA